MILPEMSRHLGDECLSPACYQCPISRTQNICRKWSISLFVKVAASSFKAEIDDAVRGRSVGQSVNLDAVAFCELSLSLSVFLYLVDVDRGVQVLWR